jgi:myo-inositol 2-dehydrogenase/D-chiro-inositol 1-dehydrogenase
MTEAALEAGLHVLCEKPLARSVAEARPLVDLAESEGLTLMPAQCLRYGRGERAIGAALRDGDLGRVHHARLTAMSNGLPRGQDGDAVGGGIVMEVLIHDIDLLRYLVGDVTRVSARALTTRPEWVNGAEDHCVATLETASGAVVDLLGLHSAAAIPPYARYQFTGGDAVVTESIGGDRGPWIGRREADGSAGAFERLDIDAVDLPTDDWYVNEILAFADCVASGETPVADPRDNLDTLATIEAIYESADRGGEQVPVDAGA